MLTGWCLCLRAVFALVSLPLSSSRGLSAGQTIEDVNMHGHMSTTYEGGARGMSMSELWEAVKLIHSRVLPFQ